MNIVGFFFSPGLFKLLLQFLDLVFFTVISQLLITEQVRLQALRVPATALSDIPSAKINRSSSLHITTYQEEVETVEGEEEVKGGVRSGVGEEQGRQNYRRCCFSPGEEREMTHLDALLPQKHHMGSSFSVLSSISAERSYLSLSISGRFIPIHTCTNACVSELDSEDTL